MLPDASLFHISLTRDRPSAFYSSFAYLVYSLLIKIYLPITMAYSVLKRLVISLMFCRCLLFGKFARVFLSEFRLVVIRFGLLGMIMK